MPCYSPLMGYRDEETGGLKFRRDDTKAKMEVACGQCLGCRLDRSRMWAMRLVHEASLYEGDNGNTFATLTYDDLLTPRDWSLSVPERDEKGKQIKGSHFQSFMKRLRKERPGQRIKYFQCGEYGNKCEHGINLDLAKCSFCTVGRPHHHVILLNCSFHDKQPTTEENGVQHYTSPELEAIWGKGIVDCGDVNFQTCAYVARYIMKKVTGDPAKEHYKKTDTATGEHIELEPEYASMSNGIGKDWYEKYKNDCFPSDEVPIPGRGVIKKVPRYYAERLKAEDEAQYEEVKRLRQIFKQKNSDEYTPERLHSKYKVKKAQVGQLQRNLK